MGTEFFGAADVFTTELLGQWSALQIGQYSSYA